MISGHVEIYEESDSGITKIFSDHNIVTVGMGYGIASFFSNQEINRKVEDYQIGYFQIGTSAVGYSNLAASVTPYFFELHTTLNSTNLGSNLDITVNDLRALKPSNGFDVSSYETTLGLSTQYLTFLGLENSQKILNSDETITHRLVLEKNLAPNIAIKELGLFIKNPDAAYKIDRPILAAYKKLNKTITKRANFKLIIDWTFDFKDY